MKGTTMSIFTAIKFTFALIAALLVTFLVMGAMSAFDSLNAVL